jgi:hypothetical protein
MEKLTSDMNAIAKANVKGKSRKGKKVMAAAPAGVIPFCPFGRFLLPLLLPVPTSSKPGKK